MKIGDSRSKSVDFHSNRGKSVKIGQTWLNSVKIGVSRSKSVESAKERLLEIQNHPHSLIYVYGVAVLVVTTDSAHLQMEQAARLSYVKVTPPYYFPINVPEGLACMASSLQIS